MVEVTTPSSSSTVSYTFWVNDWSAPVASATVYCSPLSAKASSTSAALNTVPICTVVPEGV